MKTANRLLLMLLAALAIPVINSCKPEEDNPFKDNTRLVSATRMATLTKSNVLSLMSVASTAYPEVSQISPDVISGLIVYSVKYNTTFKGEDVVASGLIAIPDSVGDFPVLSFQNGTNTLYANAPSVNPFITLYQMLECVASMGYIVVIPDYLGFGSTEEIFHPYLHKESTVTSVLDLLRACGEFDEDIAKNMTFLDEYYLMGYSQGGWSTLSLLEAIDQSYSSEFNVAGCVCGAGPYDIEYFNSYVLGLTQYPMPSFLGYISKAYDDHDFFTNTLADLFNEPYATEITTYFDGLHSTGQINDKLTPVIATLFKSDYIANFETSSAYQSIRTALQENSIEAWNTTVPLLLLHGDEDLYVPYAITVNMYNDMVAANTGGASNIDYALFPGMDHTEAVVPACIEGLKFFKNLKK